jgi:hypothetical protein
MFQNYGGMYPGVPVVEERLCSSFMFLAESKSPISSRTMSPSRPSFTKMLSDFYSFISETKTSNYFSFYQITMQHLVKMQKIQSLCHIQQRSCRFQHTKQHRFGRRTFLQFQFFFLKTFYFLKPSDSKCAHFGQQEHHLAPETTSPMPLYKSITKVKVGNEEKTTHLSSHNLVS